MIIIERKIVNNDNTDFANLTKTGQTSCDFWNKAVVDKLTRSFKNIWFVNETTYYIVWQWSCGFRSVVLLTQEILLVVSD